MPWSLIFGVLCPDIACEWEEREIDWSLVGSLITNVAPQPLYGLQNSERYPHGLSVSFQRVLIIIVDIGIEHEYDGLFCCSGAMC